MTEPALLLDRNARGWTLASAALALLPLLLQLPEMLAVLIAVTALATAALSQRRVLPIPVRLLLVMAMLAAIVWQMGAVRPGRDTGCALLAAMLAIKSSELRSLRDARSLLGFSLFAPFAAFLLDQGPLTTVLAALAGISALLALQRLAQGEGRSAPVPLRGQLRGVGRLLLIGLPLALACFWLFPRLDTPLWGIPDRAVSAPGLSDTMEPDQWLDLMADDTPALRVKFFGAVPVPEQRYWRGPVLTRFDGHVWRRDRAADRMPPANVAYQGKGWDYQIDYEPTDRRLLVALDLPTAAPEGSQLNAEMSLASQSNLSALTRWRLHSAPSTRFDSELSAYQRQAALQLPDNFNPRTATLARQWRQEAGSDDAAVVRRALTWITADFSYTLDSPVAGRDPVDAFLFDYKAGFCQHFSSAFVVLMRNAGIPARVVTGFAGGTRNRIGDYWVVRRMDAHAWAEVWLPQRGWVRVDPTAAVAPERILDTLESRLQDGPDAGLQQRWLQMGQVGDWLRRGWNDLVLSFDANSQTRLLQPLGLDDLKPGQLLAGFVTTALLALGWMAWLLARGERERDPLLRAWHRLGQRYVRLGLGRETHEPALAWAQRVHAQRPDPALIALSQRFAEARYAGTRTELAPLLRDLRRHRPTSGASS
ncbi:transglutaminaseTgpA domain-containing protein [Stenotrophomonas maltophilia]|uniref:transglutaminase family protein n=1 Tax=Stenotrophomonas maltophilia TaxID=40324 RepID=UPI0039F72EC7